MRTKTRGRHVLLMDEELLVKRIITALEPIIRGWAYAGAWDKTYDLKVLESRFLKIIETQKAIEDETARVERHSRTRGEAQRQQQERKMHKEVVRMLGRREKA